MMFIIGCKISENNRCFSPLQISFNKVGREFLALPVDNNSVQLRIIFSSELFCVCPYRVKAYKQVA